MTAFQKAMHPPSQLATNVAVLIAVPLLANLTRSFSQRSLSTDLVRLRGCCWCWCYWGLGVFGRGFFWGVLGDNRDSALHTTLQSVTCPTEYIHRVGVKRVSTAVEQMQMVRAYRDCSSTVRGHTEWNTCKPDKEEHSTNCRRSLEGTQTAMHPKRRQRRANRTFWP